LNKKGVTNLECRELERKKDPPKTSLNVYEHINPKFKVGENAPKLTKQIHLTNQCGLRVIMNMVNNEKVKVIMVKKVVEKGKEVTTNENGLIVELELKNSKA
jgi:hypothetical protein